MYDAKLIGEIAARVQAKLAAEDAFPLTGRVISVKKVRDAFESGHRTVRIPKDALITAEAKDYLYDKRMNMIQAD